MSSGMMRIQCGLPTLFLILITRIFYPSWINWLIIYLYKGEMRQNRLSQQRMKILRNILRTLKETNLWIIAISSELEHFARRLLETISNGSLSQRMLELTGTLMKTLNGNY